MKELEVCKKVVRLGVSKGFRLTKELDFLGLKEGDIVKITMERIE